MKSNFLSTDDDIDEASFKIRQVVRPFIDVAMLTVDPDELKDEVKRLALHDYVLGAIDALGRGAFGSEEMPVIVTAVLFFQEYFELSPGDAGVAVRAAMDRCNDPARAPFSELGGQAMIHYMKKRDRMAPMNLAFMLIRMDDEDPAVFLPEMLSQMRDRGPSAAAAD